jgi:hypothetical protein
MGHVYILHIEVLDLFFYGEVPGLMVVVHLVGGKLDLVLQNPALRAVPFEEACAYAAENLDDLPGASSSGSTSSLYGQDDLSCHEVSAKDDTGTSSTFLHLHIDTSLDLSLR